MDPRIPFGREAEKYVSSTPHANEASLAHLVEIARPRGGRVLDVGTGAGHTAFALAPHAQEVVALDPTPEMLSIVEREATARGLTNITTFLSHAESVDFPDATFEGVATRLAAHHFESVDSFLQQSYRLLQPGGWIVIEDTIGIDDDDGDAQLDEIERLRDPSHRRNLRMFEWQAALAKAGFRVDHTEATSFPQNAYDWLDRMSVPEPDRTTVLHKIVYSENWLRDYLRPTGEAETLTFRLRRGLLRAHKD